MISEPIGVGAAVHSDDSAASQLTRLTFDQPPDPSALGPLLPARANTTGTRRRLDETALRLFGERGYHAVSVRDLVGELGMQASSLYAHVPSKAHLLADLIRIGHEEHRDALRLALLDSGSEPADQVSVLVRAHVLFHCAYPLLARVCNREIGSLPDEQRPEILAIRLEAERLFFDVIERGERLGVFGTSEPVLAVAAIGAMGIRVAEWWRPGLGFTSEQVADTYATFAIRLLA